MQDSGIFKKTGEQCRQDVPLAPFTTWQVGGPAQWIWEPTVERLPEVMHYCFQLSIPVWFLGRGSNVLISDDGLPGLTLCTRKALDGLSMEDGYIVAESGVPLPALSRFAAKQGFGGYEFLIGIPGTVGGGVVINAGLTNKKRQEMADVLVDVEVVLPDGRTEWRPASELDLQYRSSNLLDHGIFVLRARFRPTWTASEAEIRQITAAHLAERRRKQPLNKATAGSTFKQPEGGKPAGWYIDQAGLKGYRIGGAMVSHKHANWIENVGGATAKDILLLIAHIKRVIQTQFQVDLIEEIRYFSATERQRCEKTG